MTASRLVLVTLMLGLLVAPLAADAQPTKIPRVGVAFFGWPGASCVEALRQGLRDASYVEGQTLAVEYRYAEGKAERYAGLVSELVRLKPDVIAVAATGMAQVARQATTTIPVVFMYADQPVAIGLVASLAQPGGNLTGLTTLKRRVEALLVVPHPLNEDPHAQRIVDLALRHRLPVIFGGRPWAARGALIAYGAQTNDLCRGAATLVAKILKGARPADLPVEQPTTFELVVNLKTARALGLTIPPSLLARADEVIE
jgi:putative tryptophan/tyrosine transport system substrate-binding protein